MQGLVSQRHRIAKFGSGTALISSGEAQICVAEEGLSGVRQCRGNETHRQDGFEMQMSGVVEQRRATAKNGEAYHREGMVEHRIA